MFSRFRTLTSDRALNPTSVHSDGLVHSEGLCHLRLGIGEGISGGSDINAQSIPTPESIATEAESYGIREWNPVVHRGRLTSMLAAAEEEEEATMPLLPPGGQLKNTADVQLDANVRTEDPYREMTRSFYMTLRQKPARRTWSQQSGTDVAAVEDDVDYGTDLIGTRSCSRPEMQAKSRPLKKWLIRHRHAPYPSGEDKRRLAELCKMTVTQVSNWFANARRRLKKTVAEPGLSWAGRICLYDSRVVGKQEPLDIGRDDADVSYDVIDVDRLQSEVDERSTKVGFDVRTSAATCSNNTSSISDSIDDCEDDNEDVTGSDNDSGFTESHGKDFFYKTDDVIDSSAQRATSLVFRAPLFIGQFYLYGYGDCSTVADVSNVPVDLRSTSAAEATETVICPDRVGGQPVGTRWNALGDEEPVNLSVTCRSTGNESSCSPGAATTSGRRTDLLITEAADHRAQSAKSRGRKSVLRWH